MGGVDQQVKLRGYRIELGEIEAVLSQQEGVERRWCWRESEGGEQRLVAYLVGEEQEEMPAVGSCGAYLKERLPDYMIPSAFVQVGGAAADAQRED